LNVFTGVINIDARQIAFNIIIKRSPFRNLFALYAPILGEIDIQGISLPVIVEFRTLYLLSGKAL
jgi:hypothetical protein